MIIAHSDNVGMAEAAVPMTTLSFGALHGFAVAVIVPVGLAPPLNVAVSLIAPPSGTPDDAWVMSAVVLHPAKVHRRFVGHRHVGRRQGSPDVASSRDGSFEDRIRHRRGLGGPPIHIARLRAATHDYLEASAREGTRPAGPDLENPDIARGPVERKSDASAYRGPGSRTEAGP